MWNEMNIESFIVKGRMEVISEKPFIMIDAAHNIQGLNELKKYVQNTLGGCHL